MGADTADAKAAAVDARMRAVCGCLFGSAGTAGRHCCHRYPRMVGATLQAVATAGLCPVWVIAERRARYEAGYPLTPERRCCEAMARSLQVVTVRVARRAAHACAT